MENEASSPAEQIGFWEKNKLSIVIFLSGLILIGLGVLGLKFFNFSSGPKVEILGLDGQAESQDASGVNTTIINKITVEMAGEVLKPGVYEINEGSRINDLLIKAGGLSAKADRDWVAKNINLAQKLTDGAKIYIPTLISNSSLQPTSNNAQGQILESKTAEDKININTASVSELDTLWGVGEATANKIIAGRPYLKVEDLLGKKIVSQRVWERISGQIVAY